MTLKPALLLEAVHIRLPDESGESKCWQVPILSLYYDESILAPEYVPEMHSMRMVRFQRDNRVDGADKTWHTLDLHRW